MSNKKNKNLGIKSNILFGLSGGSVIYYSFFGFSFNYIPLVILEFIILILTIVFLCSFFFIRKQMKIQKKVLIIEIIGLVLCVLLSILIGHLMVDWVVEDGKLKKIVNENLIFAFVLVAYYIGLCVYHAKRTKEWYKLNQNDPDVSNSKKDTN